MINLLKNILLLPSLNNLIMFLRFGEFAFHVLSQFCWGIAEMLTLIQNKDKEK